MKSGISYDRILIAEELDSAEHDCLIGGLNDQTKGILDRLRHRFGIPIVSISRPNSEVNYNDAKHFANVHPQTGSETPESIKDATFEAVRNKK